MNSLLSEALEAMLGPKVRDEVYSVLGRKGISMKNVPTQFDDVVNILSKTFGVLGAKVIVYKVIAELHREYSQPTDFSYGETLRDKLLSLHERVISNHIWPRHVEDANTFFDRESGMGDKGSAADSSVHAGWAGLYRYKKGVGSNPNPNW